MALEPTVEVAVLGPVEVRGAAGRFHRAAALELVVYLAFHRQAVRYPECALAIWPDRSVAPATVHSAASDARRALGRGADGGPHLPRRGGMLRLAETVTADVDRFELLAASDDPDRWLEALGLVRGAPFSGLRRADWAVLEGIESRLQVMVSGTALRGAEALLEIGRAAEAEWLVRRALVANPYDERLYRALLRATAAQGNRVGLRSALRQLCALAGDETQVGVAGGQRWPTDRDLLHPQTSALYRELLGARPASGGPPGRL